MRKSVALLFVLVFLTASCLAVKPVFSSADAAENSWVRKEPMHVARSGLGVAVVNGKIYAIGGSADNGVVSTNEEYDPATDTWTYKKPMPTSRHYFATAVYQNKIYCLGGYLGNGTVTGVNEVYDPATDMWENKASMPTPRWLLQANVVNAKIYFIGRVAGQHVNEVYDPATDAWTQKTPPPTSVDDYASVVVDNKIYLIGGHEGYGSYSNQNQIYDPENDTWSSGQQAPQKAVYAAAGVTSGVIAPTRVYVFGVTEPVGIGVNIGVKVPSIINQVFDPESDSWTIGASPPTNRINMGVAVVDDKLYAIGGSTYEDSGLHVPHMPSAVNEQYTPIGYGTVPVDNNQPAPFPIRLAVAVAFVIAALVLMAAVGVGLSVYLKKRK
jgi:N-acetylneuraminic acid mutarotase